jgi:asparagine synthase (glutamine-hydrolysing)
MTIVDHNTRQMLYSDDFAARLPAKAITADCEEPGSLSALDWMLRQDLLNYLPGDLLVKMDRMTMANSLEARAPLLDHEVVEFAARLPDSYKVSGGVRKRLLKLAYRDMLPKGFMDRPKHGFSIPVDRWLRGELKSLAADTILSSSATQRGMFNATKVAELWNQHQNGTCSSGAELWALMVLELWQRKFVDAPVSTF